MVHLDRASRRKVLAASASAAAAFGFSGVTEASSGYDHVVNLKKKGADPNGNKSITPYLEKYAGDDTLLKLPEGRYRMASRFRFTGFKHFGIKGKNATIVPDDYSNFDGQCCFKLGTQSDPGTGLQVSSLDYDFTADNTGVRAIQAQVSDGLHVSDIDINGQHDSGTIGPALFDVVSSSGSGTVSGFRAPDGGARSKNSPGNIQLGPTGCFVSHYHRGTLELRDVKLAGWPDNGLYAGNATGAVHVVGGHYANSTISNVRVGGDGSSVRGATVVVDHRISDKNQRGIRLDSGKTIEVKNTQVDLKKPNGAAIDVLDDVGHAVIDNVDVTLGSGSSPAITVHPDATKVSVKDTDIEANGQGYVVNVDGNANAGKFVMTGSTIRGDATGQGGYPAIYTNRDSSEFRNVSVHQTGGEHRRAIYLSGDDSLIDGGEYVSTEYPIMNYGSGNRVNDTTAHVSTDTVSLVTYDSDFTLTNSTIENGYRNEDSGHITARGNSYP